MKIRVIAFASAGEALGGETVELELDPGSRVSALERELVRRYPALGPMWNRLAKAIDGRLVQGDPELEDGVEVALLPPVSGGAPTASDR